MLLLLGTRVQYPLHSKLNLFLEKLENQSCIKIFSLTTKILENIRQNF